MDKEKIETYLMDVPDEVLAALKFSVPWQYDQSSSGYQETDEDGFPVSSSSSTKRQISREDLQQECWNKFHQNPQVNTAIRGQVGRVTGWGFETSSEILDIQDLIEEIEYDPRNRLYNFWPKYYGRASVEGELMLCLTCHASGFIEVDFIDPVDVKQQGDDGTGIIYHPTKTLMPLFFNVTRNGGGFDQIPSIFVARYPELATLVKNSTSFSLDNQKSSKSRKHIFRKFGGFYRFIVSWDKGFLTRRAVSYLRTTLQWLNHYENLKKYEIDHKKSSGAYVWVFTITDPKSFKLWLSMSDEDKRKTGILAKKTPGGTLVLPPGMEVDVKSPSLPKISEGDTDIMDMISSGLNEPQDVTTGKARGTFASVKASRGPMSDRISDEIAWFDRFLKYDFWGSIFFLRHVLTGFPLTFSRKEVVDFTDKGKEIWKKRKRKPEFLVDVSYPTSEMIDYEARAKGLLGTKHGPLSETVGIPMSEIARRMGFGGYGRHRLRHATEKERYPELVYTMDAESLQERAEGEKSKGDKPKPKSSSKKSSDTEDGK